MTHRSNDRGHLRLDKRYPRPVGRLARSTGTSDERTHGLYVGMCDALAAGGRLDILLAIKRRTLSFAEVWEVYRPMAGRAAADLNRLPTAATLKHLWRLDAEGREAGALAEWMDEADVSASTRRNRVRDLTRLRSIAKASATLADLPELVRHARRDTLKRTPPPRTAFNMLRLTVCAFLRDTVTRQHPLYQDVLAVAALSVDRQKTSGLSVADALAVREALGTTSAGAAAAWWALCLTGMRPAEYWQTGRAWWELRSDRVHVAASKVKGGVKERDVPIVDRSVVLHPPMIEHATFRDDMWKLNSGHGPFKTPWPTRVTPYVARRTFAHWMELARIPRSRRMLYRGSGPRDTTDLYESAEVEAFLAEDGDAMRAFIGITDDGPGLRLVESA